MNIFFCLLFLVCFDGSQAIHFRQKTEDDSSQRHVRPQQKEKQELMNIVGVNMNTPQVNIVRPCQKNDISCIGRFLSQKSGCSPVQGLPTGRYTIKTLNLNIPSANVTVTMSNTEVMGIRNSIVNEFYVNKDTNTMVMEVVYPNLGTVSSDAMLYVLRKGREPFLFKDYVLADLSNLSITWIVRLDHGIDIDGGHFYSYLSTTVRVLAGPGLKPIIDNKQFTWQNQLDLTVKEVLIDLGSILFKAFVESKICNFK